MVVIQGTFQAASLGFLRSKLNRRNARQRLEVSSSLRFAVFFISSFLRFFLSSSPRLFVSSFLRLFVSSPLCFPISSISSVPRVLLSWLRSFFISLFYCFLISPVFYSWSPILFFDPPNICFDPLNIFWYPSPQVNHWHDNDNHDSSEIWLTSWDMWVSPCQLVLAGFLWCHCHMLICSSLSLSVQSYVTRQLYLESKPIEASPFLFSWPSHEHTVVVLKHWSL